MDLVSGEVKADHILCGLLPPSQDMCGQEALYVRLGTLAWKLTGKKSGC